MAQHNRSQLVQASVNALHSIWGNVLPGWVRLVHEVIVEDVDGRCSVVLQREAPERFDVTTFGDHERVYVDGSPEYKIIIENPPLDMQIEWARYLDLQTRTIDVESSPLDGRWSITISVTPPTSDLTVMKSTYEILTGLQSDIRQLDYALDFDQHLNAVHIPHMSDEKIKALLGKLDDRRSIGAIALDALDEFDRQGAEIEAARKEEERRKKARTNRLRNERGRR